MVEGSWTRTFTANAKFLLLQLHIKSIQLEEHRETFIVKESQETQSVSQ